MKKIITVLTLCTIAMLVSACGLFNRPTPTPAVVPNGIPNQIQTAVAATLTAVAGTPRGGGTPVPPATQIAELTATPATAQPTAAPGQPTPTPGGEGNPPTLQMLAPASGAQVTANQTISVVALTTDDVGLSRVEFFADNVLYSTRLLPNTPTTYQAVFPWSSSQVGAHTLVMVAYDSSNNPSAPGVVSVTVIANNTPPQVAILAPTGPQTLNLGAQMNVQVVASDEAGVTQLQMYVDNQLYSQTSSQNADGTTPFSATFIYSANTAGNHSIVIHAIDVGGNLGMSSPLAVTVGDNTPPSVSTNYSRLSVRQNEEVVVYTNATDAAGIQRVELWADNALYNVYSVPNPPSQTSLNIQQVWTSNAVGNHTLYVRVFDVNNESTSTPATTIFVRQPDAPTPTFTPLIPTTTPYPTRTPPPVVPPPNCQIQTPSTNFRDRLPNAVRITWICTANGGLTQMDVYYQYSGTMATLATSTAANGGNQESGSYDWTPQSAGVLTVFVIAHDKLGQQGQSPEIPGVIENERPPTIVPPPFNPTVEPAHPDLQGRWRGNLDNGFFIIDLEPRIGCSETACAWGGTFADHRNDPVVTGEINGQLNGTHLTLSVEGAQPGDVTWNFEGDVTGGGNQIVGQWSEARAGVPSLQRGSVAFERQ